MSSKTYPIGVPGKPWGNSEKTAWLQQRRIQRSYRDEVITKLDDIANPFEVVSYGALTLDPTRYPLFAVKVGQPKAERPWALITGGVHGYETSGVQGALEFLSSAAADYLDRVNLVIAPCVSPWGYEVINRWNPQAIDPNRSFVTNSPAEESRALMQFITSLDIDFLVHIDLHETTDTDESEFRPALAARDGQAFEPGQIPDGFYAVGDTEKPEPGFQAAIIRGVEKITHIAPPDSDGNIIGSPMTQPGVINYPCKELGLCAGLTEAQFVCTTEVYPDSPKVTGEQCNAAQVAAVTAGLDYALKHRG